MRLQRGAYGCHLPARGGPPTCAGLLLAWWGVGDAVDWHFLWDIVGAVCEGYADALAGAAFAGDWVVGVGAGGEGSATLEVFVDYVLRGVVYSSFFIGPIGLMGPIGIFDFLCKDRARRWRARADCDNFGDLT